MFELMWCMYQFHVPKSATMYLQMKFIHTKCIWNEKRRGGGIHK